LAERLSEQDSEISEKIEMAFRLIVCRQIREKEKMLLVDYFDDELNQFSANQSQAEDFIKVGEYPFQGDADPAELAALMQVIHSIYNMEEALSKS